MLTRNDILIAATSDITEDIAHEIVEVSKVNKWTNAIDNVSIYLRNNNLIDKEQHSIVIALQVFNNAMRKLYSKSDLTEKQINCGSIGYRSYLVKNK